MPNQGYPGLVQYLRKYFARQVCLGEEIDEKELSDAVQRYLGLGPDYQRAKVPMMRLWQYFREDIRPIYALVDPTYAPIEIKSCLEEARKPVSVQ